MAFHLVGSHQRWQAAYLKDTRTTEHGRIYQSYAVKLKRPNSVVSVFSHRLLRFTRLLRLSANVVVGTDAG